MAQGNVPSELTSSLNQSNVLGSQADVKDSRGKGRYIACAVVVLITC
jgi:hypothetical protein